MGRPSPRRRSSCGGRGAAAARRASCASRARGEEAVMAARRLRPPRTRRQRARDALDPLFERPHLARGREAGRVTVESRGPHEIHVRRAGGDDRPLPAPPDDDRRGAPRGLRRGREVPRGLGLHQALRREGSGGAPPGDRGEGRHGDRLPPRRQRHRGEALRDRGGVPRRGHRDRHGDQRRQGPLRGPRLRRARRAGGGGGGPPARGHREGHPRERLPARRTRSRSRCARPASARGRSS